MTTANLIAAGVALRAANGSVLFVLRAPTEERFPGHWALPGGKADEGEDAETAARRETLEEIGYDCPALVRHDRITTDAGVDYTTFLCDVGEPFAPKLNAEHVAFAWAPPGFPPQPLHPGVKAMLETKGLAQDERLAMDKSLTRAYDVDGRLRVSAANISKATVNPYYGREIPGAEELGLVPDKKYMLLRHPDELAKAAGTFNGVPILSQHLPVTADDHPHHLVVGSTGNDAEFEAPYLRNSLVIWTKDAIAGIESEDQKELSCAYRYRADMTPGTWEGVPYDGVMRDLVGNHVALVREGRAGSDVVVGDAAIETGEISLMPSKTILTRKASVVLGALVGHLQPKLAQDAKLDYAALLSGVTQANFKAKKAEIVEGLRKQTTGKLAKDASIDDVVGLLDAMEAHEVTEGVDIDPDSGLPMEEAKVFDQDPMAKVKELLTGKVDDATLAAVCSALGGGAMDADETEEEKAARLAKEKQANDEPPPTPGAAEKDMVTKSAMDAAISKASKEATENALKVAREIREAERAVRPYVGEIAMAHDSAEEVYRTALTTLGVKIDGVHPSAFPAILGMQPKPGDRRVPQPVLAADAASAKSFAERFPGAERIGQV